MLSSAQPKMILIGRAKSPLSHHEGQCMAAHGAMQRAWPCVCVWGGGLTTSGWLRSGSGPKHGACSRGLCGGNCSPRQRFYPHQGSNAGTPPLLLQVCSCCHATDRAALFDAQYRMSPAASSQVTSSPVPRTISIRAPHHAVKIEHRGRRAAGGGRELTVGGGVGKPGGLRRELRTVRLVLESPKLV